MYRAGFFAMTFGWHFFFRASSVYVPLVRLSIRRMGDRLEVADAGAAAGAN